MPGTYPFIALCHVGKHGIHIHRHPPCGHRGREEYLVVLFLRMDEVIPAAYLFVCFHVLFIRCLGQFPEHGILLCRGKIRQVVYSCNQDVTLLPFPLCCKGVVIFQYLQCPVHVDSQTCQRTVYEERGTQGDDVLYNVETFRAVLPIEDQPAECIENDTILLFRIGFRGCRCPDSPERSVVRERKTGFYSAPRRKFPTFAPRGRP